MADEFDPFATTTGLKGDYDGVIVDAFFGVDPAAAEGPRKNNVFLWLKIVDLADSEEVTNRYGCGAEWASYDGGKTVEHPSAKFFNNRSGYAELFTKAIELGAPLKDRATARDAKNIPLGPRDSSIWSGLTFHWDVVTDEFPDRANPGKMVTFNKILPSAYKGVTAVREQGEWGNDVAPASTPPAPPQAPQAAPQEAAAAPQTPDAPINPLADLTPETVAQIKVAAASQPYAEWVDTVMALPGVIESRNMMAALGDQALYESLKGA